MKRPPLLVSALLKGTGTGLAVGLTGMILLLLGTGAGSALYLTVLLFSVISGLVSGIFSYYALEGMVTRANEARIRPLKEELNRILNAMNEHQSEIASLEQSEGSKDEPLKGAWEAWTDRVEIMSEDLNRLSIQMAALSGQLSSQAGDLPALAAQAHRLADRGLDLKSLAKELKAGEKRTAQDLEAAGARLKEAQDRLAAFLHDKA